jgi:hypothetical protein
MYHMIHATDHAEAFSLMVRAYRKISGRPDIEVKEEQLDLLEQAELEELVEIFGTLIEGVGSQVTRRWRKADSNRWSHFDRDAFQNTILGPGAAHRFKDRSASARGETNGSNPLSSTGESSANLTSSIRGFWGLRLDGDTLD